MLLLKRIDGLEIDLPAKAISAVGVFSLDVTELDAATRELEGANEELVRIGQQLEERIAEVESIAEQAAYLRMRARVHDVVGQRLSIFQRYLESGRADQGSVEELTRLANSIVQDLRAQDGPDAETALKSSWTPSRSSTSTSASGEGSRATPRPRPSPASPARR